MECTSCLRVCFQTASFLPAAQGQREDPLDQLPTKLLHKVSAAPLFRFQHAMQALGQAHNLIAVGRSKGDLAKIADLVDSFLDTPQLETCIARIRALPGGAALMDERYPPLQPDLEGLLTQRIATTHDLHHVVSGFGTSTAGENGVLAITATQIGFPAYVSLTQASQIASFRLKLHEYDTLSRAISHGTTIGFSALPFATARWEDGWELPVAAWRQRLGVTLPADNEPYGLHPS
jgi:ubiquinone biosynthesis protein COQ4